MKKVSTVVAKPSKKISQQKLTVGLDLGDRSSWYCVVDEAGSIVLEQKLSTTPKALRGVFGAMARAVGSRWKSGRIHLGSVAC
jgi:predicted NBD/HSP70 family sugar kinase